MVETGEADICLSSPPLPNEHLEWTVLDTEPLYLVLPADHPLADRKEVAIRSIAHEDFVCFKPGYGLRYVFDQMCRGLSISPKLALKGKKCRRFGTSISRARCSNPAETAEHVHSPVAFAECQTTVLRGRSVSPS
ncbi:LysR substrate-binding domain-containing protein [Bacillus licheniformis]|nr:LysR substrate-binding domain-containing protein [Bacillus licheniformis]